jgi:hypothetical protein
VADLALRRRRLADARRLHVRSQLRLRLAVHRRRSLDRRRPNAAGPQPNGAGGEIAIWSSADAGKTWAMQKQLTRDSKFDHTYVRRVVDGKPPFEFLWADGNPVRLSESRLYFGSRGGEKYFELPYDMTGEFSTPIEHAAP